MQLSLVALHFFKKQVPVKLTEGERSPIMPHAMEPGRPVRPAAVAADVPTWKARGLCLDQSLFFSFVLPSGFHLELTVRNTEQPRIMIGSSFLEVPRLVGVEPRLSAVDLALVGANLLPGTPLPVL